MHKRRVAAPRETPISIYECHLGSWARVPEDGNRYLAYRELAAVFEYEHGDRPDPTEEA